VRQQCVGNMIQGAAAVADQIHFSSKLQK
jgi:hypothetical protein